MVNFFNKIKIIYHFIIAAYYMLKFSITLGWSNDQNAKALITRSRWRITQIKDECIKNELLNFLKQMEEARFPNNK